MPESVVGELVLRVVFEFVCYWVGRVVVSVVSLGSLRCDRVATEIPRRRLRWGGVYYRYGQQVYLTAEATMLVGMGALFLMVAGGVWAFRFWRG